MLLASGLALLIWAMGYGLWYAWVAEHQEIEEMGTSLAGAFARAAERKMPEAEADLDTYARRRFDYVRHVDAHSHWGGLALLLVVFGAAFDCVGFDERKRFYLALMLVGGAVSFPLGVILQTLSRGLAPKFIAILGSGLIIFALGGVALGFVRGEKPTPEEANGA